MRKLFLCCVCLFFVNGCGVIDYYFLAPPEDTAQELFENAKTNMADKEYPPAIEALTKLNDRYPFSPFAVQARLMLGDAYFLNEQYIEAVDVYEDFSSMHPRHENIDYVLFQIGVAKYNAHQSIDLPQTELALAIESFRRIVEGHPQSAYRDQASDYIVKCRKLLAEHELYVADYYFKSKEYKAAWLRYSQVINNYPEQKELVDLAAAKQKVAFYYYQEEENDKARKPSTFKKFFDWL